MSKRTRNILLALIGIFAVAAIISILINTGGGGDARNIAGQAEKSETLITINDVEIPAYDFSGETYILTDNLMLFGINAETSDDGTALNIYLSQTAAQDGIDIADLLVSHGDMINVYYPEYATYVAGEEIASWAVDGGTLIPKNALALLGNEIVTDQENSYAYIIGENVAENTYENTYEDTAVAAGPVIVLDPGHGKSSGAMSDEEKSASGWVHTGSGWGEWRHFKYGTSGPDCEGDGCSHRVTPNGACWYPIGNGDRDAEPAINLNNCLAAKQYLEQLGYTVRITRETNAENPSITRRLSYCYPGNDTTAQPDADIFVCVHSNAGGGSGSSYIALEGPYDQPTTLGSSDAYVDAGNTLGRYINDEIGNYTLLGMNAPITFEPELIAFCKCPVVCGYMEIGFFDNPSDLEILNSSSDAIGHAIASGIDKFAREYLGIV